MKHIVDVLFVAKCPHWRVAFDRVSEAVAVLGLDGVVEVRTREIDNPFDAIRLGFLGSPTVRVDGRDVELGAGDRTDFGLQCRLYRIDGKPDAAPSIEWIKNAIVAADR
jgi:hypothetical protein